MVERSIVAVEMAKHEAKGGSWHKWHEGVNRLRILPYSHTFTKFDLKAKRCREEHISQTLEVFFVSYYAYWASGRVKVCWAERNICPYWIKYDNIADEAKKAGKAKAPSLYFFFNAVDLDEPHKGVQIIKCTKPVFLGANLQSGEKRAYGIKDYYEGYQPKASADDSDVELPVDIEDEDAIGGLKPKDALWDQLLGLNGRTIFIQMKQQTSRFNPNVTFMGLNHEARGGAVALQIAENCITLEEHFMNGVKDLHGSLEHYPGTDRDGNYAHAVVAEFARFIKGETADPDVEPEVKEEVESVTDESSPDLDIDTGPGSSEIELKGKYQLREQAQLAALPGQKVTKHRDGSFSVTGKAIEPMADGGADKIEQGSRVWVTDIDEDPPVKYRATFISYTHDKEKKLVAEVSVLPDEQDDEELRNTIREAREGAGKDQLVDGGVVFQALAEHVEIDNDFQRSDELDVE